MPEDAGTPRKTPDLSGKERKRRTRRYHRRKCPACDKTVYIQPQAEAMARKYRTMPRRLSAIRKRMHRTSAYPCPEGYGWHVGRVKKGEDV